MGALLGDCDSAGVVPVEYVGANVGDLVGALLGLALGLGVGVPSV